MLIEMDINNRLQGMLLGLIVGDALGVPYEFNKRGTFNCKEMSGYGTYNQPKGSWSDDSSLTLITVDHINKKTTLNNLMDNFVKFVYEGYMTPNNECFDVGNTTIKAIENRKYLNKDGIDCGLKDIGSNGNGSLMRISPIVVKTIKEDDINIKLNIVKDYSSLTHGNIISVLGCLIYILVLEEIIRGTLKEDILNKVYVNLLNIKEVKYLYCLDEVYLNLFKDDVKSYSIDDIKSSGYIKHTLEASLWVFLNSNNYNDSILKAINLGEDTDTVGAVSGSLLGCYYSLDSINKSYINDLLKLELINNLITIKIYE